MHVVDLGGAAALVEVVDVLGDEEEVVAERRLEPAEGDVGRVGLDVGEGGAAGVVEVVDDRRLGLVGLGRGDVLDRGGPPRARRRRGTSAPRSRRRCRHR